NQAWVKGKVRGVLDRDLCEIGVFGIKQVIEFFRDHRARHRQHRGGGGSHPSIAELRERRRRRLLAPVVRQQSGWKNLHQLFIELNEQSSSRILFLNRRPTLY